MPSVAYDRQSLFESIGTNINRIDLQAAAVIDKARPAPAHDLRQPTVRVVSPVVSRKDKQVASPTEVPPRIVDVNRVKIVAPIGPSEPHATTNKTISVNLLVARPYRGQYRPVRP